MRPQLCIVVWALYACLTGFDRKRQPMACAWLQIDGDVRGRRIQGADVPQVIDVVAVTITDRVIIFADEDLQNSVSATLPKAQRDISHRQVIAYVV